MSNELLFLTHLFCVIGLVLLALRLGKEALIACYSLQLVIGNLFVIKQAHLFGLEITCCDVFVIGSMLSLQLIQEYYGRDLVKKAIWVGFFSMLFFGIMSYLHIAYTPSPLDQTQSAFSLILSKSPRLLLASFTTFLIVQRLEIRLFGFLKNRLPESSFILRSGTSLIPLQILDTLLFTYLGLYGLMSHLTHIMLVSFLIKMLIFALMSPFTLLSKRIIRA